MEKKESAEKAVREIRRKTRVDSQRPRLRGCRAVRRSKGHGTLPWPFY
jgi:hypothetical protein